MFHISDVKKYSRCPKLFHSSLHEEQEKPYHSFVRLDEEITQLAARKLGVGDCFTGERGQAGDAALQAMDQFEWIVKGRFEYNDLRVKVPFLHKTSEGWDLYFLFIGNKPHNDDILFYCATVWVLENNGIDLNTIRLIHLNEDYVRGDELDVNELFVVSDYFYNHKGNPTELVEVAIYKKMGDYSNILAEMKEVAMMDEVEAVHSNKCTRRSKCTHYDLCFPNELVEPDNSILTLASSQHKHEMHAEGLTLLRDADPARVEGTLAQYAQIRADQLGGLYVDRLALGTWLSNLRFPLVFVDFEWDTYAIPPYRGLRPYSVCLFEYSVHVLYQDGSLAHKEYIGTGDCRKQLMENLYRDIPEKGTLIAYNADGAEKIRLRELGEQFPEYESKMNHLINRMEDLQQPFMNGIVYDVRMRGLYSLKQIMAMLDDEGYRNLDIHQGMDAVFVWRQLDRHELEETEEALEHLKAYCGMDTYAMIVVYRWLVQLAQNGCKI